MANTKSVNHAERAHALLSASGASRWLGCTPSARLEDEFGVDKPSPYAAEGTLAHELSELIIRHDILKTLSDEQFEEQAIKIFENELYQPEMIDYAHFYVDYVRDELESSKLGTADAILIIEERVDLRSWVPESFGSCDAIIIADGTMKVIDLKYGKGVPVSATGNKQLMLYALGAYEKYAIMYAIDTVELHIVQPRIDNISSWAVDVKELLDWADNEVRPKAQMAFDGKGELKAGDWCKFCKVKARCRELYKQNIELAKYDFAKPDNGLLTPEEIADIIDRVPLLVEWANSILDYATDQAIANGVIWPGHKLVAGRSTRKFTDSEAVAQVLLDNDYSADEIFESKLKSLTAIEKMVGKKDFEAIFKDLIVKAKGKPVLVPLDDKRPALGAEDAIKDFK